MTLAGGRTTRAEELRVMLADEIVRGVLAPGGALDETELARRFNVSRTPVREAIRQLAASGLVDAQPHRGAVVAQPSEDRLIGMFEAMGEIEGLCAGFSAERMTAVERRIAKKNERKSRRQRHRHDERGAHRQDV